MTLYFQARFKTLIILPLIVIYLGSCYYDNEQELYGNEQCNTDNVSYSTDIVPILERNCQLCHSSSTAAVLGAGFNLEGHENLLILVNSGAFVGSVRHDAGWSPMPKGGGKIPDCDIRKIERWIEDGSPNN